MGGGERNQRKRQQQQRAQASKGSSGQGSRAVAAARNANSGRNRAIAAVVVVLVLAGAVIVGVVYTNSQNAEQGGVADQIRSELKIGNAGVPATEVSEEKLAPRLDGGVVEEGNPDAKLTVEVYEDFLCPYCADLYRQSHGQLEKAVDQGKIKVRYHLLGFLDEASTPPGYSSRAANAAMCSVDAGKFRPYYRMLFDRQPAEGGPGYTDRQLTEMGRSAGMGDDFASCVSSGTYTERARAETAKAQTRLAELSDDGSVGTPTIVVANRIIPAIGVPNWLTDLIGSKQA